MLDTCLVGVQVMSNYLGDTALLRLRFHKVESLPYVVRQAEGLVSADGWPEQRTEQAVRQNSPSFWGHVSTGNHELPTMPWLAGACTRVNRHHRQWERMSGTEACYSRHARGADVARCRAHTLHRWMRCLLSELAPRAPLLTMGLGGGAPSIEHTA
jgi:hypothetical protein